MGIDIKSVTKKSGRQEFKTKNPYILQLGEIFSFMKRRTSGETSYFHEKILKKLRTSQRNRAPMSLGRLAKQMCKRTEKMAVVVATITDDERLLDVPKMSICALRVSDAARQRILNAGGEIITLDQLVRVDPKLENIVLLQGPGKSRKVDRHFGKAPGVPDSNTRPYVRSKGRKFEKARGRRSSRGFRN